MWPCELEVNLSSVVLAVRQIFYWIAVIFFFFFWYAIVYNLMVQNFICNLLSKFLLIILKKVKLKYACSGKNFRFTGSF